MSGWVDIHCHILPGLDDGAKDINESLGMAHMAVADGTQRLVATPHINPGSFDNQPERIRHVCQVLRERLKADGVPLILESAAEIRIGPWLLGMVKRGEVPWLGNPEGRALLLELPHQGVEAGNLYILELLTRQGVRPVLAHPERIRSFVNHPERLEPYLALGCMLQVTSGALCGIFGDDVSATVDELMKRGWVHFIASDGHRFLRRQPVVGDGVNEATRLVGREKAEQLARENPLALLNGEKLPDW